MRRVVMVNKIGTAAMYEQLAEECCELAQAALKASRLLRGDNPPRNMDHKDVWANVTEEVADVYLCLRELDLDDVDEDLVEFKEGRFLEAWEKEHPSE